jgi:hypothetical protein
MPTNPIDPNDQLLQDAIRHLEKLRANLVQGRPVSDIVVQRLRALLELDDGPTTSACW